MTASQLQECSVGSAAVKRRLFVCDAKCVIK
jgi:hypothetical protein